MNKWEYRVADTDAERMKQPAQQWNDYLDKYGVDGWELVTIKDCLLYTSPSPRDRG